MTTITPPTAAQIAVWLSAESLTMESLGDENAPPILVIGYARDNPDRLDPVTWPDGDGDLATGDGYVHAVNPSDSHLSELANLAPTGCHLVAVTVEVVPRVSEPTDRIERVRAERAYQEALRGAADADRACAEAQAKLVAAAEVVRAYRIAELPAEG